VTNCGKAALRRGGPDLAACEAERLTTRACREPKLEWGQRRSEGKAWSLRDFENGVPGVTMLTVVADEKKTARISEPSESDA